MSDELRLNRDQLETALGDDPDVIRTFELLLERLGLGGIVEQGSNSNGSYIVFSSGIQVCWIDDITVPTTATVVSNKFGTTSGDLLQSTLVWTFPNPFAAAPFMNATTKSTSVVDYFVAKIAGRTTTTGTFYCFGSGSGASTNGRADLIAIGTVG